MDTQQSNNPATEAVGAPARSSVLVVDDEFNFVILLDRVLSKRGYRVRTAANAEEALALVDKQVAFDLAIMDIKLGPTDGLALLVELKRQLPELKVIMLTAYPAYETRMASIKKGASAYFTKPVELASFLDTVRQLS
jgi:two-component system response regulator RegA